MNEFQNSAFQKALNPNRNDKLFHLLKVFILKSIFRYLCLDQSCQREEGRNAKKIFPFYLKTYSFIRGINMSVKGIYNVDINRILKRE